MKKSHIANILPFLTAILLYLNLNPYFIWGLVKGGYFGLLVAFLIGIIYFSKADFKKRSNTKVLLYLIILLFFYWITTGISIGGFLIFSCCLFLPIAKAEFSEKVFRCFSIIYSIIIAISSVVWIFVLLGLINPISYIPPLNDLKTGLYSVYPLAVSMPGAHFYRFCGPFDEPGLVGTFSGILLYIMGFDKKDWRSYALLVSGCLSLSLFFFLLIIIRLCYIGVLKRHYFIFLLSAVFMIFFYNATKDDEIISNRVWERLEWNESEGTFSGNNRVVDDAAKKFYEDRKGTFKYWFGDRNLGYNAKLFEGSSSYKAIVVRSGMLFFICYILFFAYLGIRQIHNIVDFIIYITMVLVVIYQRPWMFGLGYFFLFPYFAFSLSKKSKLQASLK